VTIKKAAEVLAIVFSVTRSNASAPIPGVPSRTATERTNSDLGNRRSPASKLRLHALIGTVIVVAALVGCSATRPVATNKELFIPKPPLLDDESVRNPPTDLLAIAQSIPESASRQQIDESVYHFMAEFYRVRSGDMQQVMTAVAILKKQPAIVASLIDYYDSFQAPEYEKRMMTLGLIGELQRTEAMPFFLRIIWSWLQLRQPIVEGPTPKELVEMIRVKAVHGLAYLRTDESDQALIDIMRSHESYGIRIAAVDAYMWNHGDSAEAAQQLYIALPAALHRFIERPRFRRGMDREAFNARLENWQKRWSRPRSSQ
jgi:hypothetical protein